MMLRAWYVLPLAVASLAACDVSHDRVGVTTGASSGGGYTTKPADTATNKYCDVIIAGGSASAIAAAISSAHEGAKTCLLEPTDWVGGQLTASGVPAIDWAWHTVGTENVAAIDKEPANVTPNFLGMMTTVGYPGRCWVSDNCFNPQDLLTKGLDVSVKNLAGTLFVYPLTVVKSAVTSNGQIQQVTAIQRTPMPGVANSGFDVLPSVDIPDWYSPSPSARYTKQVLTFSLDDGASGQNAVFVDATDWGELLAISGASYMQGVDSADGALTGNDACGMAAVFPFVERLNATATSEPANPHTVDHPTSYGLNGTSWDQVWTYRRIASTAQGVASGDLSNQNWNPGNDYQYGYLYKTKAATAAEVPDWQGGMDLGQVAAAERQAFGWHYYFKAQGPYASRITLDYGTLGTGHGLSKLPYMRDARRSIGVGNFLLQAADISGTAAQLTGTRFIDRVAIGSYDMDIRSIIGCTYPAYVTVGYSVLPYYIPLRALTNRDYGNLLVSGKTMAQTFLVNAASRLHPIEWSSGTAAGAVAAFMAKNQLTSSQVLYDYLADAQAQVAQHTPINWTINGSVYPAPGDTLAPLPSPGAPVTNPVSPPSADAGAGTDATQPEGTDAGVDAAADAETDAGADAAADDADAGPFGP